MRRHKFSSAVTTKCAISSIVLVFLLMTHNAPNVSGRKLNSSQRKTPSSSNSGHVTQPSYNTHSNNGGNSHADVAKLSYPNYNSQPNRPAVAAGGTNANTNNNNNNAGQYGWNVPNQQQGPPPAYSASNPMGGAKTNMHEPPPAYHQPNYAAPAGSNVHTPITATNMHGNQFGAPPAYQWPGSGGNAYGGHMPAGANYYPAGGALPAGATYYPSNGALPPGATYYAQPPQQSSGSGLGFGTGLIAGGLGGALLGHALTPTQTRVEAAPPAAGGGSDRVIIINNGVPVNASDGTTVINANTPAAQDPAAATVQPAPLAPLAPMPADGTNATGAFNEQAPPAGGIICMPVRLNETDPADNTKMIEVEKVACYPAPPADPQASQTQQQLQMQQQPGVSVNGQTPASPPDQAAVLAANGAVSNYQTLLTFAAPILFSFWLIN